MNLTSTLRGRLDGVSRNWQRDHPWATFYDFMVEHERIGRALWAVGAQSDIRLLYGAADAIAAVPAGGAVLDVPCGGGVALRGLRPGQDVRYVAADIAPAMLARTAAHALQRGVGDIVETVEADVEALPFAAGEFDLVVSFTGLHCFPRPDVAVAEIGRVLKRGGRLTGSALLNDTGVLYQPMRIIGRAGGLMGPSGTRVQVAAWLDAAGLQDVSIRTSGAIVYFTGTKA